MPPIPPSFSPDAQSLIATLTRRHTHLLDTQIPQLRDCKGPLSLQQCWAEEVREELGVFARQVEVSRWGWFIGVGIWLCGGEVLGWSLPFKICELKKGRES